MPLVNAKTLQGSVTGINQNEVKIKLNQEHSIPKTGDRVTFKMMTEGLELEAGTGIVSKSSRDSIWVKVIDGNPDIDMQAFIETTDSLKRQTASSSIATPRRSVIKETDLTTRNKNLNEKKRYTSSRYLRNDKIPVSIQCSFLRLSEGATMYRPPKSSKHLREIIRDAKKEMAMIDKGKTPKFMFDIRQLAVWTYSGVGVIQDRAKAAKLFLYAARGNDAGAQFDIGVLYQTGDGLTQDISQARQWYEKALGPHKKTKYFTGVYYGSFYALHNLGCMYLEGNGVPQDRAKAITLFRQAAGDKKGLQGGFGRSIDMLSLLGAI